MYRVVKARSHLENRTATATEPTVAVVAPQVLVIIIPTVVEALRMGPLTAAETIRGTTTAEVDESLLRRDRPDTRGTQMDRVFPDGVVVATLHPEDPMPRFGNGRGRLINTSSKNLRSILYRIIREHSGNGNKIFTPRY